MFDPGSSMNVLRCLLAGVAAGVVSISDGALAENYPVKPIRLIVPLAPGSTADIASRFTAEELSKALGQPVVVVNKPGAGGAIGTLELARAAPDGYSIGFASQGTLVFNQAIHTNPGYDSRTDFAPIALLGRASNVMVVHPANTAGAPADIVAMAKSRPATITFSSGGSGTSHHLSGVLFAGATAIELVHVAYRSAPQAVLAVMKNEVAMGFFNTPMVISQIKNGKLKAIGVTSLDRSPLLPNVPTIDEQGVNGYEMNTWGGFVAPAGTPPEIVERLNAELTAIFASSHAKEALGTQGFDLTAPMTPSAFAKLIADDVARWAPVLRAAGAKVD
jgi:tripartite-type tricarboxylate transporter receptor subunit TctC